MKTLKEQAKNCENCLCWHHICHSECCKMFTIKNVKGHVKPVKGKKLMVNVKITSKQIKYYELHDCKLKHGLLIIKVHDYEWDENNLIIRNTCEWLTPKGLCSHYEERPEICRRLTLNHNIDKDFTVTPNCLYRYKKWKKNTQ